MKKQRTLQESAIGSYEITKEKEVPMKKNMLAAGSALFLFSRIIFAGNSGLAAEVVDVPSENQVESEIIQTDNFMDYTNEVTQLVKNDEEVQTQHVATIDEFHTKRLIVKLKDNTISLENYGAKTIIKGPDDMAIMQFSNSGEAKDSMAELNKSPQVEFAEPDIIYGVDASNSGKATTSFKSWGVKKMEADKYAKYLQTSKKPGLIVAVIDTGVSSHKFLSGRIAKGGYDFINGDKTPNDVGGHGTHVAGTIVDSTPKLNVKILPVRVLGGEGVGTASTISNGIKYAADKGAKVINLSLGGGHSQSVDNAVSYAMKKGAVVVVAAGNEYENVAFTCPAHIGKVITVAAIDSKDRRADFSNYGNSVDVVAPGVDIVSSIPGGGYGKASGTSMAAPHISAAVAMLRMGYPSKSPIEIEKLLRGITKDLGAKGWDKYFGSGLPKLTKVIDAKSIKLDQTTALMMRNSKLKLTATVKPGGFVSWSTDNSKIAAVNEEGIITGKKIGKAVITATTINGLKASCKVSVLSSDVPLVEPTGVTLNQTKLTMDTGGKVTLVPTLAPSNTTAKEIIWTTSNDKIADVSEFGTITAYEKGSVVITATTANEISASCKVTVTGEAVQPVSISLNQKKINVLIGDTAQLWATILPATATDQRMKWSSNNDKVQIDQNGEIQGMEAGVSIIRVSTTKGLYAECEVTIIDPESIVDPDDILLNFESIKVDVGKEVFLTATVLPTDVTDPTVTFVSSNPIVADVTPYGKITGRMAGNATITVKASNGIKETCRVTVKEPTILPTGIILDRTELELEVGQAATVKATVIPSNATNKTITWSENGSSLLYINDKGGITAYREGKAVITAKTSNGIIATCTVTIKPKTILPSYIYINEMALEVAEGEKVTFTASVSPKNAANSSLTWESSDKGIAVVDQNGVVTGVKEGRARITVKTFNGKTDSRIVTVRGKKIPVDNITIEPKEVQVTIGSSTKLKAMITPENASNKEVIWASSNNSIAYFQGDGTIYGSKPGSVTITAKTSNGLTASCIVTVVKAPVPPSGIILSQNAAEINIGQTLTLTATVKPEDATGSKVAWESSDHTVAGVSDQGVVTGIGAGKALITAKTSNGITSICTVTVKQVSSAPSAITLNQTNMEMQIGGLGILTATITPNDAADKTIVWTSSDGTIAGVDSKGTVTGNSAGTAVITATTGNGTTAACTVIVKDNKVEPESVALDPSELQMEIGTSFKLTAIVFPDNTTEKILNWAITDNTIASVDSQGIITAIAEGTTVVTVYTSNSKSAYCTIIVTKPTQQVIEKHYDAKKQLKNKYK